MLEMVKNSGLPTKASSRGSFSQGIGFPADCRESGDVRACTPRIMT